ncbi:MAG: hypothetical protein QXE51_05420, partial [Nitrososphaeria archaeon]
FLTSVSFIFLMSQPIGKAGLPAYLYPCGKNDQYLCLQALGVTTEGGIGTLQPNQSVSVSFPMPLLPVPTKLHLSGLVLLASAAPVTVGFTVWNIYGDNYTVSLEFEVMNNGTVINIPEQEVVLEPYAFTAGPTVGAIAVSPIFPNGQTIQVGSTPQSGLTITALATVAINNINLYAYVEEPEE